MLWAKFLFIACACFATTALAQNYEFYDETTADYSMAPIMADDPSAATEGSSDSSNPMGVLGVVTLWPKGSQQPERRQERPRPDRCPKWGDWKNVTCWWPKRPRPDRCPKWGDWKNVTCWWPSMTFTDLPQECTYMPLPKKIPKVVQDLIRGKAQEAYDAILIRGKAQEAYDAIVYEYEQRGKPAKCGYCSRSFRCRSRNITKTDDAENSMLNDFDRRHHRHGRRGHDQCK
uniref:Uncharacterized protein n=1 Tax=Panagrolaimus sp. ES5 TaxID=591445 RepID=A0AC34GNR4_9BILA